MDGIHDMGGMHGFGPVPVEDDGQPPFAESWQGRVFANNLALSVQMGGNVDRFRYLTESIPPEIYLSVTYYERWLASMLAAITENKLLTPEQIASIKAGEIPSVEPSDAQALPPEITAALVDAPTGTRLDMSGQAAYSEGARVRARTQHSSGHTRLPRYVRGRIGEIIRDNGNQHLPDARAATGELLMQRLYTVSFTARELWGDEANANDSVCLDLWESYLEPA